MSEFTKIGVGWKTASGNGYSCVLDEPINKGERFMIFFAKEKRNAKSPDIILGYFDDSEDKRQEERDQRDNSPAINEDDIPF